MTGLPYVAAAIAGVMHAACHLGSSSEDDAPDIQSALMDVVTALGAVDPGDSEDLSPTCPHEKPLMRPAHNMVMNTVAAMVGGELLQPIRTFAESRLGALAFLALANAACCPVSKGVLTAAGWEISEVPDPEGGHPSYRIEREGVVIPG